MKSNRVHQYMTYCFFMSLILFITMQCSAVPQVDGFDYPVGKPNASGYYNAQDFGVNNHLGEDWNGNGGGDTDLGDPVYATANGEVVVSSDFGGPDGWGNVVMIQHDSPEGIRTSMYAHMNSRSVNTGNIVSRGQQIGTIGKTGGPWGAANSAHLHFEIRLSASTANGSGYGTPNQGQTDPSNYIDSRRPPWGVVYTITPSAGAHGSISPNTPQQVAAGGSIDFSASPNTGYQVDTWSVDGTAKQDGGNTFTGSADLTNIQADHTVHVTFKPILYTITPSAGAHGSISPSTPQQVAAGGSIDFSASPNSGYQVDTWSVDG
ncbi:MAG: peptidoglycan DD-metalloendopeptidase family protein, partial [Armatimonadota bacterium]